MKKKKFLKTFVLLMLAAVLMFGIVPTKTDAASSASFILDLNSVARFNRYIEFKGVYDICSDMSQKVSRKGPGQEIPIYGLIVTNPDGSKTTHVGYCIEPGGDVSGDWTYSGEYTSKTVDNYWRGLTRNYSNLARAIGLTIAYTEEYSSAADYKEARAACQIILWEFMSGYRNYTTRKVTDTALYDSITGTAFQKYYKLISDAVINHEAIPSYTSRSQTSAPTIELKYDVENKIWKATKTSTAAAADVIDYSAYESMGVSVITNGKTATFTASKPLSGSSVKTPKILPAGLEEGANESMLVWTAYDENNTRGQCLVSETNPDPVPAYMKLTTEKVGVLRIRKAAEDGVVSGVEFSVSDGTNTYNIITDSDGIAEITLPLGTYTVTELNVPGRYNTPTSQNVTISADTTTTIDFNNILKKGSIKIIKTSTDGIIENVSFTVKNNSGFDTTVTTDANGEVTLNNLIPGEYTVTEKLDTDVYYNVESQNVTVVADTTATVTFENINRRKVTVRYFDKYTNEVIHAEYSYTDKHGASYDVSEYVLSSIEYEGINYTHYPELNAGDAISGVLNEDKVIDLYYGYVHNVIIEYRDEDTGEIISETVTYAPENEHNSEYDKTSDTELEIEGYTKTKVTGDDEKGTLDTDKLIIVWYKKNPEPVLETDDVLTSLTLCGLFIGAACTATLLKKRKEEGAV